MKRWFLGAALLALVILAGAAALAGWGWRLLHTPHGLPMGSDIGILSLRQQPEKPSSRSALRSNKLGLAGFVPRSTMSLPMGRPCGKEQHCHLRIAFPRSPCMTPCRWSQSKWHGLADARRFLKGSRAQNSPRNGYTAG